MTLKKNMRYSKYQEEIFNEVEKGNSNLVINAVAGSGKTTTIVECCKRLSCERDNVKFLAFNKSIVQELESRIGSYADVSTMHAFALSIIKKAYNNKLRHRYVKIDNNRWSKYIADTIYSMSDEITPDTDKKAVFKFRCNVTKVFNLARVNLIKCEDVAAIRSIMTDYGITPMFDEIDVISKLLAQAYTMPKNLTIDFTDMLTIAATELRDDIPTFDYVFIDECQDLNTAQIELMLCTAKGGRFIAVGDRNQAINGFAGADCNSFDKIANLGNTIELPLSVNYRCGKNMVRLAQELVPQIQAHKGAIDGEISHVNSLSTDLFRENDMVLCRTSAPLVGLCMKLIQSGITAVVKGKDIAQDLQTLIENANTKDITEVLAYLENEKQKLIATIKSDRKCTEAEAKQAQKYLNLEDRCKCIENICLYSIKDTTELKSYVNRLFTDEKVENAVILSTAHKSKGLEANRVLILLPNKLPLTWQNQLDWQLKQELNLKYVALTRARKELVFIDLDEQSLLKATIAKC